MMKMLLFLVAVAVSVPLEASMSQFLGSWVNEDPSTRGLTRLKIGNGPGGLQISAKAKCGSGECDWGSADGDAYARSVNENLQQGAIAMTAIFERRFKESILVLKPAGRGRLLGSVYSRFLDGSDRTAYVTHYKFKKKVGLKRLPDLIVEAVKPPEFLSSQGVTILKAKVKNIGLASASASILRVIDYSTLQSTGAPENSIAHVSSLLPGQSQWVQLSLGYNVFNPTSELEYTADYKGTVSESDETNNVLVD